VMRPSAPIALGELGGSRNVAIGDRPDGHDQAERCEELGQRRRRLLGPVAFGLFAVHRATRSISVAYCECVEALESVSGAGERDRIAGGLDAQHLGQGLRYQADLEVAIVDEDHRIEPDVDLVCELAQPGRLVGPADACGREMVAPQHLMRVALEHLEHVGLVVLARDREDDPAVMQIEHGLLKAHVGAAGEVGAERDAVGAVLADDAAPQCVVAVEDQALATGREPSRQRAGDGIGNRGLARIAEDLLDPNRNVDAQFRASTIALADGRVLSGLFRRKEGRVLVFADEKGKEFTIAEGDIEEQRQSLNSLMPTNVTEELKPTELRDLLAYLMSLRK